MIKWIEKKLTSDDILKSSNIVDDCLVYIVIYILIYSLYMYIYAYINLNE